MRPRRPVKVVVLVLAFWVIGNALQVGLTRFIEASGLIDPSMAVITSQILGWGLLFLIALYYREPLDFWLRT